MEQLLFTVQINASPAHVWNILWNDATYRQWTHVFHPGSRAVSDWQEGSKILFLGEEPSGMNSRIARSIPGQVMVFEHLGEVHNGVEDTSIADALGGKAPLESYFLTEDNSLTTLKVTIDSNAEMAAYFADKFPAALQVVRELAESTPAVTLTVQATVQAPAEKVWAYWTEPAHIMQWNQASPDWHTPAATNDLRPGGHFSSTMAARDGSMSFDFTGTYTEVVPHQHIAYTIADGRRVRIQFRAEGNTTHITETFEAETMNTPELQQSGWQAIMDAFKAHTEAN